MLTPQTIETIEAALRRVSEEWYAWQDEYKRIEAALAELPEIVSELAALDEVRGMCAELNGMVAGLDAMVDELKKENAALRTPPANPVGTHDSVVEGLKIALQVARDQGWEQKYYAILSLHVKQTRHLKEMRRFRLVNFSTQELQAELSRRLTQQEGSSNE